MRTVQDNTPFAMWQLPFHDSSQLCATQHNAARTDSVPVRVWVPNSYSVKDVVLRQIVDGEPRVSVCAQAQSHGSGHWFETDLLIHNPLTKYRFALTGTKDSPYPYAWLNAAGLYPHDVSDARDFTMVANSRAPEWVKRAVVYQIFPDRFARSESAGTIASENLPAWAIPMQWDEPCAENGAVNGNQVYGGNLAGIEERLDYIAALGVNTLYLCPIFPAGSAHRYDATTFDEVDPLLGGNEALSSLMQAVHTRGMRLIMDLTTNHTGDKHAWFVKAQKDAASEEAGYYFFNAHPKEYVAWLGVPTLPKLDHSNKQLRERLYEGEDSVMSQWLAEPYNVDGWRIDVANMTGRYGSQDLALDVARSMRSRMPEDRWLVAEHFHDASRDLPGDGWDGAMNYTGFTKPLWAWLTNENSKINWLGLPMSVPKLSTAAVLHTLCEYNAELTWSARMHSQNQLCSHDTARTRTVIGDDGRHRAALGALVGLPGVPTLFAGDELALEGYNGEHSRTPMPWSQIDSSTLEIEQREWLELTTQALATRSAESALSEGGMRFVHAGEDSLTWIRTHPTNPVLVHVARAAHEPIQLPCDHLLATLAEGEALAFKAGEVFLEETLAPDAQCVGDTFGQNLAENTCKTQQQDISSVTAELAGAEITNTQPASARVFTLQATAPGTLIARLSPLSYARGERA